MLSISSRQMADFQAQARQRFVRDMARHLRAKFARHTADLTEAQLQGMVEDGMRDAAQHGVDYQDDIRRYLEYRVIYGAPLDQLPQMAWVGRILHRRSLSGSEKLRLIAEHELAMLRAEA